MTKIVNFLKEDIYNKILIEGNINIPTSFIKLLSYILIPIILGIITVIIGITKNTDLFFAWSQFTARTAFFLLMFLLFLKPLMNIFPNLGIIKKLMIYRRQLGIATFYFAFFHMSNALFYYNFQIQSTPIETLLWFKYGLISISILFIMYLTSNNYSIKLLKTNWKKVQRLIYIGLIFLFIHIWFVYASTFYKEGLSAGFWNAFSFTSYILIYFIVKFIEYKKVKYNLPNKL